MANRSRNTILIIPACGNSQRFKAVGIEAPKGLLRFTLGGVEATMIEHVISGIDLPTVVVTRESVEDQFIAELPENSSVYTLPFSSGQANTLFQVLSTSEIPSDTRIIVVNCDNRIPLESIKALQELDANFGTVVFKTDPVDRYGYIDHFPEFYIGAEKVPISEYALAGAFMFRSKKVLLDAVDLYMHDTNRTVAREVYLSHLFEYIAGPKIAVLCDKADVLDFGTPESLQAILEWEVVL